MYKVWQANDEGKKDEKKQLSDSSKRRSIK